MSSISWRVKHMCTSLTIQISLKFVHLNSTPKSRVKKVPWLNYISKMSFAEVLNIKVCSIWNVFKNFLPDSIKKILYKKRWKASTGFNASFIQLMHESNENYISIKWNCLIYSWKYSKLQSWFLEFCLNIFKKICSKYYIFYDIKNWCWDQFTKSYGRH